MRIRHKKISSILRSNVNKKMIQLNRIIFELNSTNDNFHFQIDFLHNFFNPRIDNAINTYREHISNMQKVALEDYNFIIERTDRFYQRKFQNLLNSYTTEIDTLRSESISAITKLDQEKELAIQTSNQLKNRIITFENDSQKDIDNFLHNFKSTVDQIKKLGESKLKTEISNLLSREQKFINDSEQKQKKMTEDHYLLLDLIKNGYVPPRINIQTIKSKIKEIKKSICSYKSNLNSLQTYALQQLSVNRNKINQLIRELTVLVNKNTNEQNSIQAIIDSLDDEFKEAIRQLNQNFGLIKQNYQIEIDQKLRELEELKIQLQKKFDEYKNGLTQNDQDEELLFSNLQKSLDDELQAVLKDFEIEENQLIQKVEDLENQINELVSQFDEMVQKLKLELEDLIKAHKQEIDELQSSFDLEKEKTLKNYESEISEVKRKMTNLSDKDSQSETEAKMAIQDLEKEKENLLTDHQKQITEFDSDCSEIFRTIQKETSEKVDHLKSQIDTMLSSYERSLGSKVNECISDNERKKNELIKDLQNRYENEMSLIRESGYSKSEYDRLLKQFQDEHLRLIEQSKQMVPFVVTNDMFANMTLVINDLEKELQDHVIMVSSRKRCLNYEWQQKYEQINKKIENDQIKHSNSRARNQIIQSLKNQISKTVKNRDDIISELAKELNQLLEPKELGHTEKYEGFDGVEEIILLKKQLNEAIQNYENSISMAIQFSEQKKKQISQDFSLQVRSINEQIKKVLNLIQNQNSFYSNTMNELNGLLNLNKSNYKKSYEESVNYYLSVFDNMKRNFLETEHLLRTKLKDHSFQNTRTFDFYHSIEVEEHKKQTKTLNELEEKNNEYLSNRQRIKDNLTKEIEELQSTKNYFARKQGEPIRYDANEQAERLEKQLKMVTNQLNIALQDLVEYKNLYISQEKKINQNFGGMPEVGTYKKKKNCANYDVL